jgi:hypothetical protein
MTPGVGFLNVKSEFIDRRTRFMPCCISTNGDTILMFVPGILHRSLHSKRIIKLGDLVYIIVNICI